MMALRRRHRGAKTVADRKGWSLRNYMALFTGVLIAVAALAGLAVRGQSEMDARQSASADASFAAQRAAAQLKAGFDIVQKVSVPLAADPAMATVFADPTKCGISFAPVGGFDTAHIDVVRLDGSIVCSSLKSASPGPFPVYQGQNWLQSSAPVSVGPTLD